MKIEVIKDTKIIEDNTKDALQVQIENDTPITETSIEVGGKLVKGDNLIITDISHINLGNIKARLLAIDELITQLNAERVSITTTKDLIEPVLDLAITDILKDPTSEDRRTKVAQIETIM